MESGPLTKGKFSSSFRDSNGAGLAPGSLTPDSAVREIEMYRHLRASRDVRDFRTRISGILQRFGISDFAHTCLSNISGIVDPFGSHEAHIIDRYAEEGFHHDDLTIRHLLTSGQPVFRSVVDDYIRMAPFETDLFKRHLDGVRFLNENGLFDVYNIPIFFGNYRALFSIYTRHCDARQFRENVNRHLAEIHLLARCVDEIGRLKFKSHFHNPRINPRLPVPARPLQLLETLARKDLTLNEAAEVLNISISTANQHIAAAKRCLKAHTTHGLILAAQREGLISPDY
jgi:DNA-binding CsgD family transcriptional regulator